VSNDTPEEITEKNRQRLEAQLAQDPEPKDFSLFQWLFDFLSTFFGKIFSLNNDEAPDEGAPDKPDTPADIVRMGRLILNKRAIPNWEAYKREHAAEAVEHKSPVAGQARVGSPFDVHRMHPNPQRRKTPCGG